MSTGRTSPLLAAVAAAWLGCACAGPPISSVAMRPDAVIRSPAPALHDSLQVDPVEVAAESDVGPSMFGEPRIDGPNFRATLTETIDRARIFARTGDPQARFRLQARILSQRISGNWHTTVILLVHYSLEDQSAGRVLWSGNLFSERLTSADQVLLGSDRVARVRELAAQDNLLQLRDKLISLLSGRN